MAKWAGQGYNSTEIELLKYLLNLSETGAEPPHAYKIAKEMGRYVPAITDNLQKLEHKGLVKSIPAPPTSTISPTKFFELTDPGRAYARAFLHIPEFVSLFGAEEVAGSEGEIKNLLAELCEGLSKYEKNQFDGKEILKSTLSKSIALFFKGLTRDTDAPGYLRIASSR